ncbi:MAG TPA: ribonuclease H-like domain-containing protein [Anaerolineales bacterium]|nr:ribonuclease H-like domain-containing protein [Anaerolineales bacterium]
MSSLADKLKALGVKKGTSHLTPPLDFPHASRGPATGSRYEIASVVPGTFYPTPRGEVFVAEQVYPADSVYGSSSLLSSSPHFLIAEWANDLRLSTLPLSKFAFLDTETSGLSGGTGTYAFLIGAARVKDDQLVLKQFFMRDPAEEPALLEGLANFLAPCEALVTFNGKAFDTPLLRTRYTLHGTPYPFSGFAHLDLLPLARRLWRERLASRALKSLEEHVLGLRRSSEEVPGYEIPWLYFDYLRTGDARPLAGVFYHNAMDVLTMAALLAHINEILENPYNGKVQHGLDFVALGKLFEDLGRWDEAARLFERGLESNLTESDFGLVMKRLSILQKRRGDLSEAVRLWEEAAKQGHLYAFIELAKYYEHKERDVKKALKWTKSAWQRVEADDMPAYMRRYWLGEIERRMKRLERKAAI